MPRVTRSRNRSKTHRGEIRYYLTPTPTGTPTRSIVTRTDTSYCTDLIGRPVVDSIFSSQQRAGTMSLSGSIISSPGGRLTEFETVPFMGNVSGIDRAHLPAPAGWYLATVAGTNPSRPKVVPLMWVQNIVQLPRMIIGLRDYFRKPKGKTSLQQHSSNYLGFQFGWKPLVEDVMVLLDLQKEIIKRDRELNQLYSSKRGLRRRLKHGSDSKTYSGAASFAGSHSATISVPVSVTVQKETWSTIRWFPTTPPSFQNSDLERNKLARRLVLGITSEGTAKGVWDIIPWTWLLGWFTNVGKYTLAFSNTVPASHSGACFMSKVTETWTPGVPVVSNAVGVPTASGQHTFTQRSRSVSGVLTPGFNLPYLDGFRLSILGALAGQRLGRWQK